jgi:hypothetical protein
MAPPFGESGPARPRITAKSVGAERQLKLAGMGEGDLGCLLGVAFAQQQASATIVGGRMKRKRALLGSNPPRNSRLETHADGPGADRGIGSHCSASRTASSLRIGVDLPIPQKPTLATAPTVGDNFVT